MFLKKGIKTTLGNIDLGLNEKKVGENKKKLIFFATFF